MKCVFCEKTKNNFRNLRQKATKIGQEYFEFTVLKRSLPDKYFSLTLGLPNVYSFVVIDWTIIKKNEENKRKSENRTLVAVGSAEWFHRPCVNLQDNQDLSIKDKIRFIK